MVAGGTPAAGQAATRAQGSSGVMARPGAPGARCHAFCAAPNWSWGVCGQAVVVVVVRGAGSAGSCRREHGPRKHAATLRVIYDRCRRVAKYTLRTMPILPRRRRPPRFAYAPRSAGRHRVGAVVAANGVMPQYHARRAAAATLHEPPRALRRRRLPPSTAHCQRHAAAALRVMMRRDTHGANHAAACLHASRATRVSNRATFCAC